LNKGLKLATGDLIGFLHADDLYAGPNILSDVVKKMAEAGTESLYGDLVYVQRRNTAKVVRYWKAGECSEEAFRHGWMRPNPTFFVSRHVYERLGGFDTSFRIAADYELLLRFLYREKIFTAYLPEVLVRMRWGGLSNKNLPNLITKSMEDYRACRRYGLGIGTVLWKNLSKFSQFLSVPAK